MGGSRKVGWILTFEEPGGRIPGISARRARARSRKDCRRRTTTDLAPGDASMPSPATRRRRTSPITTIAAARLFASSSLAVAGLLLAGGSGLVGCDNDSGRADKAVEADIRAGKPERGEQAINKGFQKAASEKSASPATAVQANVLLAQAKVEQARLILNEVDRNELTIARLVGEINDLGHQVQSHNTVIAGYKELSP